MPGYIRVDFDHVRLQLVEDMAIAGELVTAPDRKAKDNNAKKLMFPTKKGRSLINELEPSGFQAD